MPNDWPPQFIFAVCQPGAEHVLKKEVEAGPIDARPAFARPGFVTFKLGQTCDQPAQFQLPSTFARTYGFCLGKVAGENSRELATQIWALPAIEQLRSAHSVGDLHVWQREAAKPGAQRLEPGPTLLADEVEQVLRRHASVASLRNPPAGPRPPSRRQSWVVDVILVEPNQWWVGCHLVKRRFDSWPGGVPPLELPDYAVSRAYLKLAEALQWSALPMLPNDLCLELGCAPGGAAQALLDRGLRVIGVDPAEVEPAVTAHPRFEHIRRRSIEVPRRRLGGVRWLMADMNVAPTFTLDAVEDIIVNKGVPVRGMVLTLKLADWKLAGQLPEFVQRVTGWGYRDVRTRQLAYNRQEICLVALRSRSQRRVARKSRPRRRTDATS